MHPFGLLLAHCTAVVLWLFDYVLCVIRIVLIIYSFWARHAKFHGTLFPSITQWIDCFPPARHNTANLFWAYSVQYKEPSQHIRSKCHRFFHFFTSVASDRWRGKYNFMYIELATGRHCLRMFRICFTLIWPTSSWFFICLQWFQEKTLTVWLTHRM